LALELTTSFVDLKRTRPRTGFVRTNEVVEYRKYAELLEKHTELEKRMRDLRVDDKPFLYHDRKVTIRFETKDHVTNTVQVNTVQVTLAEAFTAAGRTILNVNWEENIESEFIEDLIGSWGIIRRGGLTAIFEDFLALNLINEKKHRSEEDNRYFTLTKYGRRQLAILRFANQTEA
jgi:hypothetical protein